MGLSFCYFLWYSRWQGPRPLSPPFQESMPIVDDHGGRIIMGAARFISQRKLLTLSCHAEEEIPYKNGKEFLYTWRYSETTKRVVRFGAITQNKSPSERKKRKEESFRPIPLFSECITKTKKKVVFPSTNNQRKVC